jgi:tripartite-type tricarboxylate transporter receptor subunit TctC
VSLRYPQKKYRRNVYGSSRISRRSHCAYVEWRAIARAAEWPERLVKLVVPFPPAGAIDVVARLIMPALQKRWGKDIVIENKPGAGGNIGNDYVAKSAPDGYTLLLTQSGIIVNQFLYPKLSYDPVADFAPVSLLALVPNVMVVPISSPAKTVEELIAYAKTKTLTFGSAGNGTSSHMCGELLKRRVGVEMIHVPYRGSAPALNDLLAGRLDVMIDSVSGMVPQIESSSLRALGVTSARPLPILPKLRPLADSALPGFEAAGLVAAFAPAKTPTEIVANIQKTISDALLDPTTNKRLTELGDEIIGSSPQVLAEYMQSEMKRWGPLIKDARITVDG